MELGTKGLALDLFPESVTRTEPIASLCPCNLGGLLAYHRENRLHLVSVTGFGTCAHSSQALKGSRRCISDRSTSNWLVLKTADIGEALENQLPFCERHLKANLPTFLP